MGICATTLKRACRRHGIKRWPRRQIAKLSKALNQMGYAGAPPPALVHSAVTTDAVPGASTAPKPAPMPQVTNTALVQQQQQQQAAAAAAAAAAVVQQHQQQQHMKQFQAVQQQMQANQMPGMPGGMMPHMAMMGGMGMPNAMMNPAAMQAFMQQQATMASMMGHMGGMPQMPQMQQQQMQQQPQQPSFMQGGMDGMGPSTGGMQPGMGRVPSFGQNMMQFMFDDMTGSAAATGGAALVNELGPSGPSGMMLGGGSPGNNGNQPSAMHISSALLPVMNRGSVGNLGGASEMNMASGFSLPPSDLLDALDAGGHTGSLPMPNASTGGGSQHGASSQQQMAAIHDLFKNAPGSLESFMELLSDDLPVV
uniref:RWP-RK domain-containing protein n=1 Tax=Chlamydomonas leiostraca TaxID=1034604 RepID=A0A7S0RM77_9CHLO